MPEPKLSPAQFAEKLKSKYPQYASIDDATLIDRVLQKYPQYGDIVNVNDAGEEVKKKSFPRYPFYGLRKDLLLRLHQLKSLLHLVKSLSLKEIIKQLKLK